ncbi:hypothetical protein TNCV_1913661 [Trichonephila clavipes]|nr:hypothetical protein TNCV_1913661 [Trichonephila clavipes]
MVALHGGSLAVLGWNCHAMIRYLDHWGTAALGGREDDSITPGKSTCAPLKYCRTHNLLQVPIAELAERWTELPQISDESRSFFRVHTGYFSNIPKCIKAEFIASWGCSQSSVVSSSQR